jgi:hypothetical protein
MHRHSIVSEGPYCCPALGSLVAGLRPYAIRRLILTEPAVIRLARIEGRRVIHLGDLVRRQAAVSASRGGGRP